MKNMSYRVTMRDVSGLENIIDHAHKSETFAVTHAKKLSTKNPSKLVFISFYRKADGQSGYINRSGASLTGESWTTV